MKTLVRIQKSAVENGHVKVTVILSDGSTYSHVTDSTVYTDYVDDEENALKQEEAIRILSTKIQKANNLDDNWEPLEKLEVLKQNKFYESINETAKQEVIDDAVSTDKVKVSDSCINVRENETNWYVDCKTCIGYTQYAKSDFTLKDAIDDQKHPVSKDICKRKLKSINAYPSKFEIFDTEDNRYILSIEEAYRNFTRDEWLCDQVISLFNEEGQSKILLELQIHGICFMREDKGIIRIF
jgi:hypothetical protein